MTTRTSRPGLLLALSLLLACASYARALRGEFQLDDVNHVERFAGIKRLAAPALPSAGAAGARPVTELTYALNYAVGRLDPVGYHAVNLALHLAATALVFALGRRLARVAGAARGEWSAAAAAGMFALHPLQTQAVSYVSQRSEVLASLSYVAALLLLLEGERLGRTWRGAVAWSGALAAFVIGLGAKPVAITLPAAYVLVAAALAGTEEARRDLTTWSRRALLLVPFAAYAAWYGRGTTAALAGRPDAGFAVAGIGPWQYLLTQARVVATYLRLLVWPVGQSVDWQFPVSRSLAEPAVLASGALLVALLGAGVALIVSGRRRDGPPGGARRLAGLGILWFFLVLSVTSSVVPIVDVLVEHRVYLASWGLFLAAAAGVERLSARAGARGAAIAVAGAAVLLLVLGALAHARNAVWETREALWRDALRKTPDSARAHLSLGYAVAERGRYEEALREYEAALAHATPALAAQAYRNAGAALVALGRPAEAIAALRRGLEIAPGDEDLLVNLGVAFANAGELAVAEQPIRRALEIAPDHPIAWNVLGAVLLDRRDLAGALAAFDRAAALNPDFGEIHLNRAAVLDALGRRAEACAARREALAGRLMARERDAAERLVAARCR